LALDYIKKLIGHATNVFSIISLLLALTTLFFPLDSITKISLTGLFAILSFLPAGFYVWKETMEKLPKVADLVIECKSVIFGGGGWSGALPLLPLKFRITLEFRNRGEEKAKLTRFQVTKCYLGTDLLEYNKNVIKLHETSPNIPRSQISLPYDIPKRDWRSLVCELPVELQQKDPPKFAELVKGLQVFEIEFKYEYEDMNGDSHSGSLIIRESFEDFRQTVLQQWIQSQQHELVYILKDISLNK
jgi:hypothetical protein